MTRKAATLSIEVVHPRSTTDEQPIDAAFVDTGNGCPQCWQVMDVDPRDTRLLLVPDEDVDDTETLQPGQPLSIRIADRSQCVDAVVDCVRADRTGRGIWLRLPGSVSLQFRRAAARAVIPGDYSVAVTLGALSGDVASGRLVDLSTLGFGAIVRDLPRYHADERLALSIALPTPLDVLTQIAHAAPLQGAERGYRIGGRFTELSARQKRSIKLWITALNARVAEQCSAA